LRPFDDSDDDGDVVFLALVIVLGVDRDLGVAEAVITVEREDGFAVAPREPFL
jgi:hypothetical protein